MVETEFRRLRKKISFVILAFALLFAAGCTGYDTGDEDAYTEDITTFESSTEELSTESTEEDTEEETEEPETEEEEVDDGLIDMGSSDIPPYSHEDYIELNNNKPSFSEEEMKSKEAFENYSDLDHLGRCGVAYANLCPELMPEGDRGEIGDIRPSGWHTVKYRGVVAGNYLYNRCHLIAFSLAGENANEKNLITGTRYFNVSIMTRFEDKVRDYIERTGNHVLYRVTPVYEGDNLVADGVQMEAYSVEDEGRGICYNVFCYNIQPDIVIDYANGESFLAEGATTLSDNEKTYNYVLNKNTKKIHLPTCKDINKMAEHNKEYFTGTLEEAEALGYVPCKNCMR